MGIPDGSGGKFDDDVKGRRKVFHSDRDYSRSDDF